MLRLDIIGTLKDVFGQFANVRPWYLSTALYYNSPSTPVIAIFSLFTGILDFAAPDPQANPLGFAVRFLIRNGVNSNIICQSSALFPTSMGEEKQYYSKNFGTQSFYSINGFILVNTTGESVFIQYRWCDLEFKEPKFLFNELPSVFAQRPISVRLVSKVAGEEDITDDCTKIWTEDRNLLSLMCSTIVYSVIVDVQGIEPSANL
ncbi:catalase-like domain-containing protein [Trichoderma ceciliae]